MPSRLKFEGRKFGKRKLATLKATRESPSRPASSTSGSMSRIGARREPRRRLLVHVQKPGQETTRADPYARFRHWRFERSHRCADHVDDSKHSDGSHFD